MISSTERTATSPTRFFVGFAVGLLPALAFALLGWLFLRHTYENASYREIVTAQQNSGGIYGSALRDDFYDYKVALYRSTTPRIAAIGSSRAWGLQQLGFREPFVSLGGPVRSVADGERLLADMRASGPMPAIVLFAVDYWWFNDQWNPDTASLDYKQEVENRLGMPFRPAMWLHSGKVGARDFVDVALRGEQLPPPLPAAYGVLARYSLHGFAPDGHYRYLGDAFGLISPDRHFQQAIAQIAKGRSRYVFGARASDARIERFKALLAQFEAAGTHVIAYLPPVSSVVRVELARQGTKLAYIEDTRERLRRDGLIQYEFTDASPLGASDCEFVDGYHAGDALNLRVVRAIAQDPASGLAPHVDLDVISSAIARASGHVLVDHDAFAPYKEIDFLDLSCPK